MGADLLKLVILALLEQEGQSVSEIAGLLRERDAWAEVTAMELAPQLAEMADKGWLEWGYVRSSRGSEVSRFCVTQKGLGHLSRFGYRLPQSLRNNLQVPLQGQLGFDL